MHAPTWRAERVNPGRPHAVTIRCDLCGWWWPLASAGAGNMRKIGYSRSFSSSAAVVWVLLFTVNAVPDRRR